MTQEEFIKKLESKGYPYDISGDKIIVTLKSDVRLYTLTSLPSGVEFRNGGRVSLNALTSLPPDVKFENGGRVDLASLTSLPPGVVFRNGGRVILDSLTGDWFDEWSGNIEGIDSKRLLNLMISKGVFER